MGRRRVIAVSQTAKQYLLDHCDVPPELIRVIYRGTDPRTFPRLSPSDCLACQLAGDFPQLQGKRLIALPGRLSRLKAHHHLINLIGELKSRGITDVAGIIVGGMDAQHDGYVRKLKASIDEAGLNDEIVFTGHRTDMREIYAISAVVLAVSNKAESFGRTALALCIGTPTVGFDLGGVGEILAALFPAGRVPNQDCQALVDTVAGLLTAPVPPIAPNTEFLLSNMCQQTLQTYAELIDQGETQP